MERTETLQILFRIFQEMKISTKNLNLDSCLGTDIGLDSLEIVELHCQLEKKFGIRIPPGILSPYYSIDAILQLVNKYAGVAV
jgi:acyl carrier protein